MNDVSSSPSLWQRWHQLFRWDTGPLSLDSFTDNPLLRSDLVNNFERLFQSADLSHSQKLLIIYTTACAAKDMLLMSGLCGVCYHSGLSQQDLEAARGVAATCTMLNAYHRAQSFHTDTCRETVTTPFDTEALTAAPLSAPDAAACALAVATLQQTTEATISGYLRHATHAGLTPTQIDLVIALATLAQALMIACATPVHNNQDDGFSPTLSASDLPELGSDPPSTE